MGSCDAKLLFAMVENGPVGVDDAGKWSKESQAQQLSELTSFGLDQVKRSLSNLERLGFFTPTRKRLKPFAAHFLHACMNSDSCVDKFFAEQEKLARLLIRD